MLEQRLADARDVAVAEDAEAAGEELLPLAVALGVLVGQEAHDGLGDGQPDGRRTSAVIGGLTSEGQSGVDVLVRPGVADPGVVGVVADQPGPLGAGPGHDVEVVEVVAGRRPSRARASRAGRGRRRRCGPRPARRCGRSRGAVDALVADARSVRGVAGGRSAPLDPGLEVVDLLELGLLARPVLVVLVRRVGAPVAGGVITSQAMIESASRTSGRPEVAHLAEARARPRAARRGRRRRRT